MSNYRAMYYKLFNAMTDAIQILQQAQQAAEEIYISSEEYDIEQAEEKGSKNGGNS